MRPSAFKLRLISLQLSHVTALRELTDQALKEKQNATEKDAQELAEVAQLLSLHSVTASKLLEEITGGSPCKQTAH